MTRHAHIALLLGLAALIALPGCEDPRDNPEEFRPFTRMEYYIGGVAERDAAKERLVEDIDNAEFRILFAFFKLEDVDIANALMRAKERGVEVQGVGDEEFRDTAGFEILLADMQEPTDDRVDNYDIHMGDTAISYLPDPLVRTIAGDCDFTLPLWVQCERNDDSTQENAGTLRRPEDYNNMTHNFVIVDDIVIHNYAGPFDNAPNVHWFGWRAFSTDLFQAYEREFKQMFSGVFATDLDQFNGPNKSTTHGVVYDSTIAQSRPGRFADLQPGYVTPQGMMELRFNPQQRLVKELIDEIYMARGSIWLVTDELYNEFVIRALEYKINRGFDVRIVLRAGGSLFDEEPPSIGLATSNNPNVVGGVVRVAPVEFQSLPTLLITDHQPDRFGTLWPRRVTYMTHQPWYGTPFDVYDPVEVGAQGVDDVIRIYRSDLFADGAQWTQKEYSGSRNEGLEDHSINRTVSYFLSDIWPQAQPLNQAMVLP